MDEGRLIKRTPLSSEEKQKQIKIILKMPYMIKVFIDPYGGFR
jgi:hypothetical protein